MVPQVNRSLKLHRRWTDRAPEKAICSQHQIQAWTPSMSQGNLSFRGTFPPHVALTRALGLFSSEQGAPGPNGIWAALQALPVGGEQAMGPGLPSRPGTGAPHGASAVSRHHTLGASGHSSVHRHRPDCGCEASLSAHCLQLSPGRVFQCHRLP